MTTIRQITPGFAVAGALAPGDFARLAAAGVKTVINFRPDGEVPGQMTASEGAGHAKAHALAYVHIPAAKFDVFTDPVIEAASAALADPDGPVLAHCASGQRALMIWAAARARREPVDRVLGALASAGIDFSFLRDDLEAQAGRATWHEGLAAKTAANSNLAGVAII